MNGGVKVGTYAINGHSSIRYIIDLWTFPLLSTHAIKPISTQPSYMLLRNLARRPAINRMRLAQMTAHLSNGAMNGTNGTSNGSSAHSSGVNLADLHKTNVFTSSLPPDPAFPTPADSHKAPRRSLGPRMVKGALYTYVRPEESKEHELLGVSERAMRDIGLKPGEEKTEGFKQLVAGNKFFWDEESREGIYPWAQCYGGAFSICCLDMLILTNCRMAIVRLTPLLPGGLY